MITQLQEQGAVQNVTLSGGVTVVRLGWGRNVRTTGSGTLSFPDPAGLPLGGPLFSVLNDGAGAISIATAHGQLPASLPQGASLLAYRAPSGWRGLVRSGPSTHHAQAGRSDPSAFPGPDLGRAPTSCSKACDDQQEHQVVPMYINSCVALNELREPVRAADLRVPNRLEVRLSALLERDANHTHATDLSAALQRLLFRQPIQLDYDPAGGYGTSSRHPHHIRLDPSDFEWDMPAQAVTRKVWRSRQQYRVGSATRTLEVRFVAEVAAADAEKGARGALLNLFVFSDEVNPSFVEGGTVSGFAFTRDDPVALDIDGYVFGLTTKWKRFHPQLLLAANVPTTFQAPCGSARVPVGDELWEAAYLRKNGSLWSDGPDLGEQAWKNCVFSDPASPGVYTHARCMTVGGDVSRSELYPFVTIENGAGYGGTYFRPANPGWDESEGDLTAVSDVRITECRFPQGSGVDVCDGHPDEPYGGVGGTHRCFLTSEGAGAACLPPAGQAQLVLREPCCAYVKTFDSACVETDRLCSVASWNVTSLRLRCDDYDLAKLDVFDRFIEWRAVGPNPDYVRSEWDPDASFAELDPALGTWSSGANFSEVTGVESSGSVRALNFWLWPSSAVCAHSRASATVKLSSGKKHVFFLRYDGDTGYAFEADPAGSITIYLVTGGAIGPILAQKTGLTLTADAEARAEAVGTSLSFRVGAHSVSATDATCRRQGLIGVGTTSTAAGARFDDLLLEDANNRVANPGSFVPEAQLVARVRVDNASPEPTLTVELPTGMRQGYLSGGCQGGQNQLCGETVDGECSGGCTRTDVGECVDVEEVLTTVLSSDTNVTPTGGAQPPAVAFESVCPRPFKALEVTLPTSCKSKGWPFERGMTVWVVESTKELEA